MTSEHVNARPYSAGAVEPVEQDRSFGKVLVDDRRRSSVRSLARRSLLRTHRDWSRESSSKLSAQCGRAPGRYEVHFRLVATVDESQRSDERADFRGGYLPR